MTAKYTNIIFRQTGHLFFVCQTVQTF